MLNFSVTGHAKSLDITSPLSLANTSLVGFDVGSRKFTARRSSKRRENGRHHHLRQIDA